MRTTRFRTLRIALMVLGVLAIILSVALDWVGLSKPGLGLGQVFLIVVGAGVLLVGALGRRVVALYRTTAILLLNTLLLFVAMELVATVILRAQDMRATQALEDPIVAAWEKLPYYAAQDWSTEYWHAREMLGVRYHPYVLWRSAPLASRTLNVDADGLRRTTGTQCQPGAYRVFAFGGSTMWGLGAPDWGTIASYLQADLQPLVGGRPVCVTNFGQMGFVSTQGLIELERRLQMGDVPDLVVFYDGVNDVWAGYEFGVAGVHYRLRSIADQLEGSRTATEQPLVTWLKGSRSFQLLSLLVNRLRPQNATTPTWVTYQTMGISTDTMGAAVTQAYLNNYKMVAALSRQYGFQFLFFCQPVICIGPKPLAPEEETMRLAMDPALVRLYEVVYGAVEQAGPEYPNLVDIARLLDAHPEALYFDWGHLTPPGNALVAQKMAAVIQERAGLK
jgi:lysophospholipase L1-like esterase